MGRKKRGKKKRSVIAPGAFRIYHQALYLLNLQYLVFRQTSYFQDCRLIHTFC